MTLNEQPERGSAEATDEQLHLQNERRIDILWFDSRFRSRRSVFPFFRSLSELIKFVMFSSNYMLFQVCEMDAEAIQGDAAADVYETNS